MFTFAVACPGFFVSTHHFCHQCDVAIVGKLLAEAGSSRMSISNVFRGYLTTGDWTLSVMLRHPCGMTSSFAGSGYPILRNLLFALPLFDPFLTLQVAQPFILSAYIRHSFSALSFEPHCLDSDFPQLLGFLCPPIITASSPVES